MLKCNRCGSTWVEEESEVFKSDDEGWTCRHALRCQECESEDVEDDEADLPPCPTCGGTGHAPREPEKSP